MKLWQMGEKRLPKVRLELPLGSEFKAHAWESKEEDSPSPALAESSYCCPLQDSSPKSRATGDGEWDQARRATPVRGTDVEAKFQKLWWLSRPPTS